jgi:hypothetical protein
MRHTRLLTLAAGLLALAVATAQADSKKRNHYRWKDAQGNLHFDDALPNEALQFGYDVISPSGIVVRHVAPPKTTEQLKADEQAAAQEKAATQAATKQAQSDAQMLAAYPNEAELASTQNAQLEMIDQYIESTRISLQSQEKSLTDMLSHAADLERTGKTVPPALRTQIESLRANVEKQKAYIAGKQQEKLDSAKRFEAELAHYRELRGKAKAH